MVLQTALTSKGIHKCENNTKHDSPFIIQSREIKKVDTNKDCSLHPLSSTEKLPLHSSNPLVELCTDKKKNPHCPTEKAVCS